MILGLKVYKSCWKKLNFPFVQQGLTTLCVYLHVYFSAWLILKRICSLMCCVPSYHLQPYPYMVKTYSAIVVVSSAVNIIGAYVVSFNDSTFKWYTETEPVIAQ